MHVDLLQEPGRVDASCIMYEPCRGCSLAVQGEGKEGCTCFKHKRSSLRKFLYSIKHVCAAATCFVVVVQVSTNFLSTRPVLQGLQEMPTVPLAEELVHSQHPGGVDYYTDKHDLQQVGLFVL